MRFCVLISLQLAAVVVGAIICQLAALTIIASLSRQRSQSMGDCNSNLLACIREVIGSDVRTPRILIGEVKIHVEVKQSRNRPGVAQRVPGGLDSQIFMAFGT